MVVKPGEFESIFFYLFLISFSIASAGSFCKIPIHSYPFLSHQRFIQIKIEEESYLALIDTGAAFSMARKELLDRIVSKDYLSASEFISVNGERYLSSNFFIPEIGIGKFITEIVLKEEDKRFWTHGSSLDSRSFLAAFKTHMMYQVFREAVVGIDLFKKYAAVFDFPHSAIYLSEEISDLIEDPSAFTMIPFEIGKAGVILTFQTDWGEKKFLLDSAATESLIRIPSDESNRDSIRYFETQLAIDEFSFGVWKFRVFDIAREFDDIDGFLGIDFFKTNIIGLDFLRMEAYIQTPKLGSKERFTYWLKCYFGIE